MKCPVCAFDEVSMKLNLVEFDPDETYTIPVCGSCFEYINYLRKTTTMTFDYLVDQFDRHGFSAMKYEHKFPTSLINKYGDEVPLIFQRKRFPGVKFTPYTARVFYSNERKYFRKYRNKIFMEMLEKRGMDKRTSIIPCDVCNRQQVYGTIQLHHIIFISMGGPNNLNLIFVCRECHLGIHQLDDHSRPLHKKSARTVLSIIPNIIDETDFVITTDEMKMLK